MARSSRHNSKFLVALVHLSKRKYYICKGYKAKGKALTLHFDLPTKRQNINAVSILFHQLYIICD